MLIYGENGETGHFGTLTFDKVRGDQTIGFRHLESDNGRYVTGLSMWQQPNIPSDILHEKYREVEAIADSTARRQAWRDLRAAGETTTELTYTLDSLDPGRSARYRGGTPRIRSVDTISCVERPAGSTGCGG